MQRRALARGCTVVLLLLGCLGARLCRDLMSCVKHSAMDWCRLDAPLARLQRPACRDAHVVAVAVWMPHWALRISKQTLFKCVLRSWASRESEARVRWCGWRIRESRWPGARYAKPTHAASAGTSDGSGRHAIASFVARRLPGRALTAACTVQVLCYASAHGAWPDVG